MRAAQHQFIEKPGSAGARRAAAPPGGRPATPQPGKDAKPSHLNLAAFQQKYAPLLDRLEQADGGSSTETVFKSLDGDGNGVIEGAEMGDLNAKVNAAIRADYKGETVDSTAAAQKSIDRQARHPPPLPSAFSLPPSHSAPKRITRTESLRRSSLLAAF